MSFGGDDEPQSVLRRALREGDLESADHAMAWLLDAATPDELDPGDLLLSLDAMERLGQAGQSTMFQSFIEYAVRHPVRSLPPLIARLTDTPISFAGQLCAAVLAELLEFGVPDAVLTRKDDAARALIAAVASAARTNPDWGRDAIGALAAWSGHEALPEARAAIEAWLDAAVAVAEPNLYSIGEARKILAALPDRLRFGP